MVGAMDHSPQVMKLFQQALQKAGLSIFGATDDGRYIILHKGTEVTVSLDNVAREFAQDKNPKVFDTLAAAILEIDFEEPPWSRAKSCVYFSAEPSTADLSDAVATPISERFSRVAVLQQEHASGVQWIT